MAEVFDFGLQQHKIKMDGKFFENNLFAVAGDTGRRLEVQLLDSNSLVQNTTGITLRLNATVDNIPTYSEATPTDPTRGLYTLDLANGMFLAPGDWDFQWEISDASGNKLHSFPFVGTVGINLSEGGTEATNFYFNIEQLKQLILDLETEITRLDSYESRITYSAMNENINFTNIMTWEIGGIDASGNETILNTGIRNLKRFKANKDLHIVLPVSHNIRIHAYNDDGTLNQINAYSKNGVMDNVFKPNPLLSYKIVIYSTVVLTNPTSISSRVLIEDMILAPSEIYTMLYKYITDDSFDLKTLWNWEIGGIDASGNNTTLATGIRNKEPIDIHKSINIILPVSHNIRIHAYNSDGTFNRSNVYSKNAVTDNIFVPEKGLKYRMVIFSTSTLTNTSQLVDLISIKLYTQTTPLKNKVINFIGDSQGSVDLVTPNWWQQISAETGAVFKDYAWSGTSVAHQPSTHLTGAHNTTLPEGTVKGGCMVERYMDIDVTADATLVAGAENDDNVPIGTWNSMDESTFMGALNVIYQGLKKLQPSKLIVTMTQIQNGALWDKSVPDPTSALVTAMNTNPTLPVNNQLRAEAIRLKSKQYGYYCIDLWSNSGLNGVDTAWSDYRNGTDYLHQSLQGHTKEARYVKGELTKLFGG